VPSRKISTVAFAQALGRAGLLNRLQSIMKINLRGFAGVFSAEAEIFTC